MFLLESWFTEICTLYPTKRWDFRPSAPVGLASYVLSQKHIKHYVLIDEREIENNGKENDCDGADGHPITIHEFMMTAIKLL